MAPKQPCGSTTNQNFAQRANPCLVLGGKTTVLALFLCQGDLRHSRFRGTSCTVVTGNAIHQGLSWQLSWTLPGAACLGLWGRGGMNPLRQTRRFGGALSSWALPHCQMTACQQSPHLEEKQQERATWQIYPILILERHVRSQWQITTQ